MARPKPPTIARPATGLGRYYMDCGWYRHPKFAGQPIEALFLFEAGVGYCTEHNTNGRMTADLEQLSLDLGVRLSWVRKGASSLIDLGVWRRSNDGRTIEMRNWEDHNPLAEEVTEYTELQRARSSYGNHVRHHERKGVNNPECPHCRQDDPLAGTSLANLPSEPLPSDDSNPPAGDLASDPSLRDSHGLGWDGSSSEASPQGPPPDPAHPAGEQSSRSDEEHPPPTPDPTNPTNPAVIDVLLDATWTRLAEHDLRQHLANPDNHVRDRTAWTRTATTRRRDAHEQRARAEIAGRTRLPDPVELAELLDPSCGPDDGGLARARRAAEETAARAAEAARRHADARAWDRTADERLAALDCGSRLVLERQASAGAPRSMPAKALELGVKARMRQLAMGERLEPWDQLGGVG